MTVAWTAKRTKGNMPALSIVHLQLNWLLLLVLGRGGRQKRLQHHTIMLIEVE